ncbi:MAG: hypothetical protein E5V52_14645, partial [Mesorhizobium sp.]
RRPGNQFVAGFIGTPNMNFIDAMVGRKADGWTLTGAGTVLSLEGSAFDLRHGDRVVLGIRPPDLKTANGSAGNILQGTADLIEFHGNDALVTFGSGGKEISALVPARECPPPCRCRAAPPRRPAARPPCSRWRRHRAPSTAGSWCGRR